MTSQPPAAAAAAPASVTPNTSAIPSVTADQRQQQDQGQPLPASAAGEKDTKTAKRRFFGLGKKKESSTSATFVGTSALSPSQTSAPADMASSSASNAPAPNLKPHGLPQPLPISPSRAPFQSAGIMASSPSRLLSGSPRPHSPASSEIFERNVQEQVPISVLGGELSPAHIPAHVMTEDHIPPALEASAQAITSDELNPDDVEIVMSASHQPAASVLEPSQADTPQLQSPVSRHRSDESDLSGAASMLLQQQQSQPSSAAPISGGGGALGDEDSASNYGQLDPTDVRRLSFISFKDIVHSEHHTSFAALGEAGSRDSLHMVGSNGAGSAAAAAHALPDRAASPLMRSPRSPTSVPHSPPSGGAAGSPLAVHVSPEMSPVRSLGLGSTAATMGGGSSQHGELTIETMRQALRKTASGDLSAGRHGASLSPVGSGPGGADDGAFRELPRSSANLR